MCGVSWRIETLPFSLPLSGAVQGLSLRIAVSSSLFQAKELGGIDCFVPLPPLNRLSLSLSSYTSSSGLCNIQSKILLSSLVFRTVLMTVIQLKQKQEEHFHRDAVLSLYPCLSLSLSRPLARSLFFSLSRSSSSRGRRRNQERARVNLREDSDAYAYRSASVRTLG